MYIKNNKICFFVENNSKCKSNYNNNEASHTHVCDELEEEKNAFISSI